MRVIPRLLLTLILLIIFGALGFLYINSQSVVVPDTPAINMGKIEENSLIKKKRETIRKYLEEKRLELAYQESLLKEKRDLLAARRQEIEEYILIQVEKIRTEYQEELKNFQEKLEGQYQEFVQTKEEEYLEQVLVKKELYTEKLQEQVRKQEENFLAELATYREDMVKDFYLAKLNYDLKLNLLDLPAEERERYLEEIKRLEEEYNLAFQEKELLLQEEMENRIGELEAEYNQELAAYQKQLENSIKKELEEEKAKNQQLVWSYLEEQEKEMAEEIEKKVEEIRSFSRQELATLEALIQDISQEYFSLEAELSILEKEVRY